jgi:hypothetical protein
VGSTGELHGRTGPDRHRSGELPNLAGVELPLFEGWGHEPSWSLGDRVEQLSEQRPDRPPVSRSGRVGEGDGHLVGVTVALTSMVASVRAVSGVWSPMSSTACSLVSCRLAARNPRSARHVAARAGHHWDLDWCFCRTVHPPSLAPPGMAPEVELPDICEVAWDLSPAGWSGRSTMLLSDYLHPIRSPRTTTWTFQGRAHPGERYSTWPSSQAGTPKKNARRSR